MENRGLLFIPDISGFTRFVNDVEIDHSRMIIQELLELLINSNQLGLEISEIEGDAILFYKFGDPPDLEKLYKQVEKMFYEFNRHILSYDNSRYCYCKACNAAVDLKLKVITHYGEFTSYNVKNFSKLIGKDVIVAHQLLKNEIEQHEYWLLTRNIVSNPPSELTDWMLWNTSIKQTDNGPVTYHYTNLGNLKKEIKPDLFPQMDLSSKTKMISVSGEYETDIITLFHATGDFNYRHRWMEGVKKVEEVNHFLPRVGMKCRCVMDNGNVSIYSSSYSYTKKKIEFSETEEKTDNLTYFVLEKLDADKTKLTIEFYIKKNIISEAKFKLTRKKEQEDILQRSLQNLEELVKEIKNTEIVKE